MQSLTQERVRQLFYYNCVSGSLTWIVPHGRDNRIPAGTKAGTVAVDGSLVVRFDGRSYRVHKIAWLWFYGTKPKEIDHRNCNPLDNRIHNLRPCTHAQNTRNRGKNKNTASGLKGAYKDKKVWYSRIMVNGVDRILGRFQTAQEAADAYDKAAKELHGSFARTNGGT